MSGAEEKLLAAAADVSAEIAKARAWYEKHPFIAGVAFGVILAAAIIIAAAVLARR